MRSKSALVAAVSALVISAAAVAAPVGTPPQLVGGSGTWLGSGEGLSSFTAGTAVNPGGGEFRIDAHGFFSGMLQTTCVAISGTRAVLIGKLREPIQVFGQTWDYAGLYVEDNGSGGAGRDRVTAFVAFGPVGCRFLFDFGSQFSQQLVTGNAVVMDGHTTFDSGAAAPVVAHL